MVMGRKIPITYKVCTPYSIYRCGINHPNRRITIQEPICRDKAWKLTALSFSGDPNRSFDTLVLLMLLLLLLNKFISDGVFVSFKPSLLLSPFSTVSMSRS